MAMTRRTLLKLIPMVMLGGLLVRPKLSSFQIPSGCAAAPRQYQGANLSGWWVAVGDSVYACPGESPVSQADIETAHPVDYSELRANIQKRCIMAHNITFLKITDSEALNFIHTCTFRFRLPFIPTPDVNANENAQTLEGGTFVWDGDRTRLDYGMAFQWILNPWGKTGTLNTWTGSTWTSVGKIDLDTEWHTVEMVINFFNRTASLVIDTISYPTQFTTTEKQGFGTGTDARFQVEIVSVDPRPDCQIRAMHKAQFKDWTWTWDRCTVFMPLVAK